MEDIALNSSLLVLSCIFLVIGTCGGPLIIRFYFIHGGKDLWLASLLLNGGLPIPLLIILTLFYIHRRKTEGSNANLFYIKPFLFKSCVIIGFCFGLGNFLYVYASSKLPVSTSSLISATQLAFVALFAFLLVKQRFTKYSIIAIVLLTIGAVILALHSSSDVPEGESSLEYFVGLGMILLAAALAGFVFPLLELLFGKAGQEINCTLMMEAQTVISCFAAAFSLFGMFISNDFKDIILEAKQYELGEAKYYVILLASAIIYQCQNLGNTGVIFCSSSLLCGIIVGAFLPVTETLGVFIFQENFQFGKGVALALSLLGLASYFYGEIKVNEEEDNIPEESSYLLA